MYGKCCRNAPRLHSECCGWIVLMVVPNWKFGVQSVVGLVIILLASLYFNGFTGARYFSLAYFVLTSVCGGGHFCFISLFGKLDFRKAFQIEDFSVDVASCINTQRIWE